MKHVLWVLLLAGCASAPSTAPARRSEPRRVPTAPAAPAPVRPYGTLDLDAKDEPLARVLDAIADAADRPIAASLSSATCVTLTLHAVPWRDALDYVVTAYHLDRKDSGRLIVVKEPPHNHLQASGASPTTWLLLLARQAGFSVVLPGHLEGEVDLELWDVRYEDALRASARTSGLDVEPVR